MKNLLRRFWAWYEKFYSLNLSITAGLFALQLAHLYWLTTHVVLFRLFGIDYFFTNSPVVTFLIILADYTEIPAIIATSIFYIRTFKKERSRKALLYLFLVNSQWIHLFWITDEVVLDIFGAGGSGVSWNPWIAWIAIAIDYLELPVIFGTIREVFRADQLNPRLKLLKRKTRIGFVVVPP